MSKNVNIRWQVILLVLLMCMPVYAQRRTRQRPAGGGQQKAQQEAQEREQRRRDEEDVRNLPDAGADLAFVVAQRAAIQEQPRASSALLRRVERGEHLALIEREPVGTWYKVIHIDSAIEGWIDERSVVIKLTANRENGPPLEEERTGTESDPELIISNLEKRTDLKLRLNGTLYVVRANTTRTFTLKPGRYDFYGWSPGISPAIGGENLKPGTKYSWTFQILTR